MKTCGNCKHCFSIVEHNPGKTGNMTGHVIGYECRRHPPLPSQYALNGERYPKIMIHLDFCGEYNDGKRNDMSVDDSYAGE